MERKFVYLVMLARTWRFYDRYIAAMSRAHQEQDGLVYSDAEDFLLACLQCCWHVKDWIKHDEAIPQASRAAIGGAIFKSDALKVVQAIATGSKHLEITDHRIENIDDSEIELVFLGAGQHAMVQIYRRLATNERISAPDVIKNAMQAWSDLLKSEGLPYYLNDRASVNPSQTS